MKNNVFSIQIGGLILVREIKIRTQAQVQNKILLTLDYSGKNHETLGRLHHKIKYFIVIFLVKKYFHDNNYSLGNTTKDVYLGDDNVGGICRETSTDFDREN